jgi:hypothetical protein
MSRRASAGTASLPNRRSLPSEASLRSFILLILRSSLTRSSMRVSGLTRGYQRTWQKNFYSPPSSASCTSAPSVLPFSGAMRGVVRLPGVPAPMEAVDRWFDIPADIRPRSGTGRCPQRGGRLSLAVRHPVCPHGTATAGCTDGTATDTLVLQGGTVALARPCRRLQAP